MNLEKLLILMGQDVEVSSSAAQFLKMAIPGMYFQVLFINFQTFYSAINMNQVPLIIIICAIPIHILAIKITNSSENGSFIGTAIAYDITYFVAFSFMLLYTTVFTKFEAIKKCLEGFKFQKELFFEDSISNIIWSLNDYASVLSLVILSGASSVKDQAASLISYCFFQFLYMFPLSCSVANFSMV